MEPKTIIIGEELMGIWGIKVISYLLNKIYPNNNIEYKNDSSCDFIIQSVFKKEKRWNKDFKKYIYWSGETIIPSKSKYETKSLYVLTTINDKRNNYTYTPYVLYSPYIYKKRKYVNNSRSYLLAYCNSNKNRTREFLFNLFVEKTSDQLCHSYGECYGSYQSTQKEKIPGKWDSEELIDTYKNYKFVIAMENKIANGYVTEKILNAFYSGAIPIYWGSSNVNDFFNKKAFINVSDFLNLNQCVDYIINMDETQIKEMQEQPIYNETNDLINLCNDEYNEKNDNKVLKEYLQKMKDFLED